MDLPVLCENKLERRRCRICDKGEIPRPGSDTWKRWTRGLVRTLRARLDGVGLGRLATTAAEALLLESCPMPEEVAPLLADITRLPISVRCYWEALDQGVDESHAYRALRGADVPQREAATIAIEVARELAERRRVGRRRIAPVTGIRIAIEAEVVEGAEPEIDALAEEDLRDAPLGATRAR